MLGGDVKELVLSWSANRDLSQHRSGVKGEGGPPLFVNFGSKVPKIAWCGHIVNEHGCGINEEYLQAVQKIPEPKNAATLRQFLASCNRGRKVHTFVVFTDHRKLTYIFDPAGAVSAAGALSHVLAVFYIQGLPYRG